MGIYTLNFMALWKYSNRLIPNLRPSASKTILRTCTYQFSSCQRSRSSRGHNGNQVPKMTKTKLDETVGVTIENIQEDAKTPPKETKVSKLTEDLKQWKPIYRFKHVLMARFIQRLKIYQSGFTCFGILPWSVAATLMGESDITNTYIAVGGSILACLMLYIMGTFSSRIIGAIYIHKKNPTKINLARLTFMGSRIDTELHTESFVHLTDLTQNPADVYIKLETIDYLEEELGPLYLSLKYGEILDLEAFQLVFGNISELKSNAKVK